MGLGVTAGAWFAGDVLSAGVAGATIPLEIP